MRRRTARGKIETLRARAVAAERQRDKARDDHRRLAIELGDLEGRLLRLTPAQRGLVLGDWPAPTPVELEQLMVWDGDLAIWRRRRPSDPVPSPVVGQTVTDEMVEEVAEWWCRYIYGGGLATVGSMAECRLRARARSSLVAALAAAPSAGDTSSDEPDGNDLEIWAVTRGSTVIEMHGIDKAEALRRRGQYAASLTEWTYEVTRFVPAPVGDAEPVAWRLEDSDGRLIEFRGVKPPAIALRHLYVSKVVPLYRHPVSPQDAGGGGAHRGTEGDKAARQVFSRLAAWLHEDADAEKPTRWLHELEHDMDGWTATLIDRNVRGLNGPLDGEPQLEAWEAIDSALDAMAALDSPPVGGSSDREAAAPSTPELACERIHEWLYTDEDDSRYVVLDMGGPPGEIRARFISDGWCSEESGAVLANAVLANELPVPSTPEPEEGTDA